MMSLRYRFIHNSCAVAFCFLSSINTSQSSEPYLSFVACPIARDVGADADLCFYTEHEGKLYALVNPPDWGRAQLKHQVLVEGEVISGEGSCGAQAIKGRYSVLPELDLSCHQITAFDGNIIGKPRSLFYRGGKEQQVLAKQLLAELKKDPSVSLQPAIYEAPPKPLPQPPFKEQKLIIYFPFDNDRASGPDMMALVDFASYVIASQGTITIESYQGASKLENGHLFTEKPGMSEQRAQKMTNILLGLDVKAEHIQTHWQVDNLLGNGQHDWKLRRVELRLQP